MSRSDDVYKPALKQIKLPILTLDNNWHKLFTQADTTPKIKKLEKQLNDLLKKQGKVNTEEKKVKAVKRKLMSEIMDLADQIGASENRVLQKKLEERRRLVEECNEKLEEMRDNSLDLPRAIDETNYELMLETMDLCYKRLEENRKEIEYYNEWIQHTREELKANIIKKQERESSTYELYQYMHNILGRDVIDVFDMRYNPEEYRPKKKGEYI